MESLCLTQATGAIGLRGYHSTETLRCSLLHTSLDKGATIGSIVDLVLTQSRSIVGFSAFAVYLLNRDGKLERAGIKGNDLNRAWADLAAMDLERARRAFQSWPEALPYAEPLIDEDGTFADRSGLREYYERELGSWTSGVRMPLNGSNQTFGMFEAVNWNPALISPPGTVVSWQNTLRRAIAISMACSASITVWRARRESLAIGDLVKALLTDDLDPSAEDWWLQVQERAAQALSALSQEQTNFRAVAIHVWRAEAGALEVLAKSAEKPQITWGTWRDIPIPRGQFLAGTVFETGRRQLLEPITDEHRPSFANWEWIQQNRIVSCCCYPLRVGERVLGTMTVYRVASQHFSSLDTSLTGSFADAFALFWDLVNARRLESEARRAIQQLQDDYEAQRLTQRSKVLLHQAKNGWREMQILIRRLASLDADGRVKEIARRSQDLAEKELASLLGDDELAGPQSIDVCQELRDLAKSRQGQFRDAHIKVRFDLSPVPLITMPEHELREVLNNLIANAIWAVREAKRSQGEIELGAMLDNKGKRQEVVVWVRDNGIGIPRDLIPMIFTRGFTTSRAKGGTGLGLFLARSIVESYGGEILVESRVNDYARFEVRWPMKWIAA